jgi:hypothetical protein
MQNCCLAKAVADIPAALVLFVGAISVFPLKGDVLFEDHFNGGIPGWTVVQPPGAYLDGPLLWQYDLVNGAFVEQSNIYTDDASYSLTATAPMLINDTITGTNFTYTGRLTAGDDDGFGLIFGYQDELNFFRVTFARQARSAGFPWRGWSVDRKVNGATTNLFGFATPGYVQSFVNRASIPFDVTISVNALNRLTLTVRDNPTGAFTNYQLVANQLLPASANGKVGIFTWGMSGGNPPGFRIQNLSLSPAALAGTTGGLTNWTAVVPPRALGSSTTQNGQPFWSFVMDPTGSSGTLAETGDCFQGNDASGQVDFTGSTLVTGDTNWSNYVVAARIIPHDDDAHGILLRYKDSTNFYRIALRSQVSATGPPAGLSIQKNVNRVYTEIYRDNPVRYNPIADVPYDLVAQMEGNTLNVLLVADPEGTAQVHEYGPFNVTGVNGGKAGLFSWAMAATEFDWISVQDAASLYVSSAFGSPLPGKGLTSFPPGVIVNASAGVANGQLGTRRSVGGWTGSGSVPANGTGTNVAFRINGFSRLHWLWHTEHQLSVTNGIGGTVTFPPGEWFSEGTNVTVSAQANTNYAFAGWSGDAYSTEPILNIVMNRPYALIANFSADTDNDSLPDSWEEAYFGAGNLSAAAAGDWDGDGRSNLEEFQRGSHPVVPDILRIDSLRLTNNAGILIISNNTGTRYQVERTSSPPSNWITVGTTQFVSAFTSSLPASNRAFWRLRQPVRPVEAPGFVPGSWTLVVLPDTQVYAQNYPELFEDQTRWIVENKDRHNIKYVLHLGDIVNNNTALIQWTNARAAMSILDGVVPYAIVPGNHDYGPGGSASDRSTYFNEFFPLTNYLSWPTFGGVMEPNKLDNSYHLFSAGGVDWLILALEWGPRNGAASWASQIASNYPAHKKILITHAYMYFDDTRYDWATKGAVQRWNPHAYGTANDVGGTNDGEELWEKVVKVHPNFVMVFNGHVLNDGLGRLSSTNEHGDVVHQMLVNYQMKALGGEAFLRLVEFHPDGKTVQVKAYSPYYGTYKTDAENQFSLTLEPPLR